MRRGVEKKKETKTTKKVDEAMELQDEKSSKGVDVDVKSSPTSIVDGTENSSITHHKVKLPVVIDLDPDDNDGEEQTDPTNPRSPLPAAFNGKVNPKTWKMFQQQMELELRNALKDEKSKEFGEAERRCWEMLVRFLPPPFFLSFIH